jgi:hypothetical protein
MQLTSRAVSQRQQVAATLSLTRPVQPAIPLPFRAMALHHLASLAAITAGVTAAAAPSTLGVELSPVTVTLLSIAGTLAVGWGVMRASVAALQKETETLRRDFQAAQSTMQPMLREALERIARIEGALGK